MIKKTKLGLGAIVAFAFMFATSVSVVAQEKVNGSEDKVEVKEKGAESNTTITKSRLSTPYFYNGTGNPTQIDAEVIDYANWDETGFDTGLSCVGDTDVPCQLDVPDGMTIQQYLDITLQGDPDLIRAAASKGRNP